MLPSSLKRDYSKKIFKHIWIGNQNRKNSHHSKGGEKHVSVVLGEQLSKRASVQIQ
jgi:hypothetical protein